MCILIIDVRVVGDMSLSTQGEIQFPKTIFDHPSLHVNDLKRDAQVIFLTFEGFDFGMIPNLIHYILSVCIV